MVLVVYIAPVSFQIIGVDGVVVRTGIFHPFCWYIKLARECLRPRAFLDSKEVVTWSLQSPFIRSAMVRVVVMPVPIPSTTDLPSMFPCLWDLPGLGNSQSFSSFRLNARIVFVYYGNREQIHLLHWEQPSHQNALSHFWNQSLAYFSCSQVKHLQPPVAGEHRWPLSTIRWAGSIPERNTFDESPFDNVHNVSFININQGYLYWWFIRKGDKLVTSLNPLYLTITLLTRFPVFMVWI